MLFTSMYYTRAEQPSRISAWYLFNGIGVAGGGLIGYGIGHIKGALASWRLEFLIVGAVCALWGVVIALTLANSPLTSRWFSREEKVMMLARMRRNQTGIESKRIRWGQVREAVLDYKTVSCSSFGHVLPPALKLRLGEQPSGCSFRSDSSVTSPTEGLVM
jgi:MFS family permease